MNDVSAAPDSSDAVAGLDGPDSTAVSGGEPGRAARAASVTVRCAACDTELDSLRAGHVAIFDSKVRFFCNHDRCRMRFLGLPPQEGRPSSTSVVPAPPPIVFAPVEPGEGVVSEPEVLPSLVADDPDELFEPVRPPAVRTADPHAVANPDREMAMLLVGLTLVAGLLAMALELAEATPFVRLARLLLVGVGTATIVGHAYTARIGRRDSTTGAGRDDGQPFWLVPVFAPLAALAVAVVGHLWVAPPSAGRALFLASTIVAIDAGVIWIVSAAARGVERGRSWLLQRVGAAGSSEVLQVGAPVSVLAGEVVPVDFVVVEGEATLESWVPGSTAIRRKVGEYVVAGFRVVAGQLRGTCTQTGDERTLLRGAFSAPHRPDIHAESVRLPRMLVERWAPGVALVAAGVHALVGGKPFAVALVAVATYAAMSSLALASMPSLTVARGVLQGAERGVVFESAMAWDRAARVTAAVFCARGTLLRGEPELVEIELFSALAGGPRGDGASDVLSLAAAALSSERHPIAWALKRAARERGLATDLVRNVRSHEGYGVTGVASNGEAVCVGSRELMLERRVSVAVAEDTMAKLESTGRTVVLVSRAGRLLGLCALQDGLRTGARAAVQHLLDVRVEPVLMSSDTTATCDALGRALDIDHLRPEVRDDEGGAAVARIRDTGAVVAVLGHAWLDDAALGAADVSVVLGGRLRSPDETPEPEPRVLTVHDDVRDGALAVALVQRARRRTSSAFAVALGPAVFGTLVITFGLLPPEYAPIAQFLGTLAAAWPLFQDDDGA
ncbi:MAG: cation-translocating P-type ATPase [Deltaproteobacteria bacterium]|nr:cation-translocating P-type ATPase [Deltaproteobacteria bacterium]